ncbi:hypothetical protein [Streptomyces violascens]|uniref:Helix-turn-helix domain-containing protein n=1 Tax=Streptomyces violascens TaxID=67381 RepID=A0ABQ3QYL7_9ACTN|nr:hypothetical protein [Streptomyces violascens]GGU22353.1 hypothetical protein GCM10010289_49810 [Streptomyces violascens]GHI42354.1 hypothetical protein Sviol_67620 [Streptomyces violascens]
MKHKNEAPRTMLSEPAQGGIDASSEHVAQKETTTQGITVRELLALPAVVDLRMAAKVLHMGRSKAYELAQHGRFPCPLLRIGTTYRVPTAHLIRLVGLSDPEGL